MSSPNDGLPASIQAKLLSYAKAQNVDYNRVLERYALERFIHRLGKSPHSERFVLKGAMMMVVWLGETLRPTRDADFLGFGELNDDTLLQIFRETCAVVVDPDGMEFLAETVKVEAIREDDRYGGRRVTFQARLGKMKLPVQIDVGIGDAVTPEPEWLDYPSLLGMPPARLRAYRPETSIAEKFHIMATLGLANSRMKDFFDIAALAERESFEGERLASAITATFERRNTELPADMPTALRNEFAADPAKQRQWKAFIERNGLPAKSLADTVTEIRNFLWPVVEATSRGKQFSSRWSPGGPWRT